MPERHVKLLPGQVARDKSVISRYLNKVFKDGELERKSVVAKYATTAADGKTYQVEYFNLDAIYYVTEGLHDHRPLPTVLWNSRGMDGFILCILSKGYLPVQ